MGFVLATFVLEGYVRIPLWLTLKQMYCTECTVRGVTKSCSSSSPAFSLNVGSTCRVFILHALWYCAFSIGTPVLLTYLVFFFVKRLYTPVLVFKYFGVHLLPSSMFSFSSIFLVIIFHVFISTYIFLAVFLSTCPNHRSRSHFSKFLTYVCHVCWLLFLLCLLSRSSPTSQHSHRCSF